MSDTPNKNYFTTGQMRNALIQIEDKMVQLVWMEYTQVVHHSFSTTQA